MIVTGFIGLYLATIGGAASAHAPAERVQPPARPPVVITFEDNTAMLDVAPPQRLDVIMHGDTRADSNGTVLAWYIRCDHMGGEPIWWPTDTDNADQYICEGVDY